MPKKHWKSVETSARLPASRLGCKAISHFQMQERLQKLIAAAGIASRRHAEELIEAGEATVNGETVRELGTKADPARDHIKVRGRFINPLPQQGEEVYVLLFQPPGYLPAHPDTEG